MKKIITYSIAVLLFAASAYAFNMGMDMGMGLPAKTDAPVGGGPHYLLIDNAGNYLLIDNATNQLRIDGTVP